jgi:putative tricarboxylic transport membrane protein
MLQSVVRMGVLASAAVLGAAPVSTAHAAWEPTRPVEIVVPAGPGGGADQMARVVQGIVTKHALMKQSLIVVNKAGGAGGEGFLDVKGSRANPHKLIITLSNLFTTPLATGIPFNWKDLTPVAMLALDEFVLWVNADKPYKSVKEYLEAVKAAPPGTFKMGGTGSKQEDQIITVAVEKAANVKFTYIPYKSTPPSTTRSRRWRSGRPARSVRSACSTPRSSTITRRSRVTLAGTASRPASRRDSTWST